MIENDLQLSITREKLKGFEQALRFMQPADEHMSKKDLFLYKANRELIESEIEVLKGQINEWETNHERH